MDPAFRRRVIGRRRRTSSGPHAARAIIDTASGVVEIGHTLERNFRLAPLLAAETEQTKTQRDREMDT